MGSSGPGGGTATTTEAPVSSSAAPGNTALEHQAAGDLARVTCTCDKAELYQRGEPRVRESGVWRIDDRD